MMRNVFDQYTQPENRLTRALLSVLAHEPRVLRRFLKWIGHSLSSSKRLAVSEQSLPGLASDAVESGEKGLADGCIYCLDDESQCLLIENKVQSKSSLGQIRRHMRTMVRRGFALPNVLLLCVDQPPKRLPRGVTARSWQKVYEWLGSNAASSSWVSELREYMRIFESRMVAEEYDIRGTITMFDGLHFDDEHPYTYREGKRLIRLLGDELQKRKDLIRIGMSPSNARRSAIRGKGTSGVWDFLPLIHADEGKSHTDFPHFTMILGESSAKAAITVPNGIRGGFRTHLRKVGADRFKEMISLLARRIQPVIKMCPLAKPYLYAAQRHYRSQSSDAILDSRIEVDLRAAVRTNFGRGVKYQPGWLEAIYQVLVKKRSNIQFGIEVVFPYEGTTMLHSRKAIDLFAETWKAASPLLDFVLKR